jgi:glycosyltransferase involved in cell wall biosynthesis
MSESAEYKFMPPEVSVVIGTFNRAHLLEDTLKVLGSQHCPQSLRWEIVVVDNNSTDATRQTVTAFSRTAPVPVRYVFEPRQGLSHARNRGIQEAHGFTIAFTDDDVIPTPDWIVGVSAALARWRADGVGGRVLPRWEAPPPEWLLRNPRLLSRLAIMDFEGARLLTLPTHGLPRVWGANMAFRRHVFDKVGVFDPRRGMTGQKFFRGEEVDLINRALESGLRIAYDSTLTVFHRIGPERMQKAYFRKLFFDLAEGEVASLPPPPRAMPLGAPFWSYRMAVLAFWKFVALSVLRHPDAFDRQLDWLYSAGRLWGHWKNVAARPSE